MLGLVLFGVGHLLVVLVVTLSGRLLRRQPDLQARRNSIFELNSRPMRIEAAESELSASRAEAAVIDKRIIQLDAKIADTVPLEDSPFTTVAYMLVALILAEAEAGLVWLLSGPVNFLSLSPEMWAFAAPPFAGAWIVMMHVLLGWAVADNHRPARTVRRGKVGAALCGAAVIVGGWLTLSGRNLTDTAVIEQLAGAGLMTLAGLVSVCAAFSSLVATTLLEARHHERERARLSSLRDHFRRHVEAIEKDLARQQKPSDLPENPPRSMMSFPPESPNTPPTVSAGIPTGVIPTALVLVLSLLSAPLLTYAQSANPKPVVAVSAEAPAWASAPAFARANVCEIMPDITDSVDRLPLKLTLSKTADLMATIIDRFNCAVVRITPFAGTLFVSIEEIVIPVIEDPVTKCLSARPANESARRKALGLLYPSVATAHQQQATDACVKRHQQISDDMLAKRRAAIAVAAQRLRAIGDLQPRGPCTALAQAVQRALLRSQSVIAITDGIPTCTPPATATHIPPDGNLLFLLIPPSNVQDADRANLLLDRIAALERSFQGALAILAPEATPTFWQGVGR